LRHPGSCGRSPWWLEIDVVQALRVEMRVEISEVNGLVRDVSARDVEVIAVVEEHS
jgi:hypothetical protein